MPTSNDKKLIKNTFEIVIMITLLSAMIALAVIAIANDMYAFVKPERSVTLTLDTPQPLKELSHTLRVEGIIKNPTVFSLFITSKGKKEKLESFSGKVTLRQNMSYREIMLELSKNKEPTTE